VNSRFFLPMYQGIIRLFKILILTLITLSYVHAQSSFIPFNDDYYHLIDRLEIKRGKFTEGFHSNVKPFERKAVVALTDSLLKEGTINLTDRDWETIDYLREDSWEWTKGMISTDSAKYNKLAAWAGSKILPQEKNAASSNIRPTYTAFTIRTLTCISILRRPISLERTTATIRRRTSRFGAPAVESKFVE
jgi:hypothetical protein